MLSTDLDEALARLRTEATVSHKGPNDTDASLLRIAAEHLRRNQRVGGSNLSDAVARVIPEVASLLEQHPPLVEPHVGDEVEKKGHVLRANVCAVDWPGRTVSLNFRGDPPS